MYETERPLRIVRLLVRNDDGGNRKVERVVVGALSFSLSLFLSLVCILMSDGILILTVSIGRTQLTLCRARSIHYDDLLFGHRSTPLFPVGKIVG